MSPVTSIPSLLLVLLFPLFSNAKIISKANYNYPILDPDEATIAAAAIHTDPTNSEIIKLRAMNRKIDEYASDRDLITSFYPSKTPTNHLVFIMTGLGGNVNNSYSTFLAAQTQIRGADAVIVPNVITPNFIISTSNTGLVGGSAADAQDLYPALEQLKQQLNAKGRVYSKISLVGYSHGALTAAFLKVSDQRAVLQKDPYALHFDSILLINPPIDLLHAIRTIDSRAAATHQIGLKRLIEVAIRFKEKLSKFAKMVTTSETHVQFAESLKLEADEKFALIGKALSMGLPSSILATQAVDDLGVLPQIDPSDSADSGASEEDRSSAAHKYNFEGYVTTFFAAHAKKFKVPFVLDELNQVNSLTALTEDLRSSKNVFLMHNMDDLLLTNGQGYWLDQLFGNRCVIYPTGGHLGNLWYPDNLNVYATWLYYGRI